VFPWFLRQVPPCYEIVWLKLSFAALALFTLSGSKRMTGYRVLITLLQKDMGLVEVAGTPLYPE
jgi:hypothetical protein